MENKKCDCMKNRSKNLYGSYDAMEDVNDNEQLQEMIDNTDAIECDK